MIRLVPSRQPVDRSCCMSPPSLQEIKRMEAHIRPVPASVSPIAAKINTVITKALEIGFESEMPSEILLTRTNRKTSPTQTSRYRCLLYTSDAADEEDSVDLGGRRIIKKK